MNKGLLKKFTGKHWWADSSKAKEEKIRRAIFTNEDKKIDIDFEYEGSKGWLEVSSTDGIHFMGKYGEGSKSGTCEFTLYKNEEEYLLFGGLIDDGVDYHWFIKLKPE